MLESFKPGQELVLKAFDKYWGGKQGADRLVFRSIPEARHESARFAPARSTSSTPFPCNSFRTCRRIERPDPA